MAETVEEKLAKIKLLTTCPSCGSTWCIDYYYKTGKQMCQHQLYGDVEGWERWDE